MSDNEGIRVQEVRSCLLCGTEGTCLYQNLRDRLFGAPGTWTLMRCPNCRLVWLNPRPVPRDIGKLYERYYTHDVADDAPWLPSLQRLVWSTVPGSGYRGPTGNALQRRLGKALSWIGPVREVVELGVMTLGGLPKGKLLDVGCGNGRFLARMRDLGWKVVGVEADGQAVKVARQRFGLDVHEGTLEEAGFPSHGFDAITMNHVIEHVLDSIGTLRECSRVLKPGGRLVVVTPNIESLAHRLFGAASRHLEPPRHIYLFSPRTLLLCTERAGLHVLKLRTTARSASWMWAASRLTRRNGALPGGSPHQNLWLQLEGLAFQALEHGLRWVMNVGEEIVLIATK